MKAGRNSLWRKDHSRRARAAGERRLRARACWVAVLAIGATLAPAATPAQAVMGGVSPTASVVAGTADGLAFSSMRSAGATWYGPGLYGNRTACGQVLRPRTVGVAHRSLPCGTAVKFAYRDRYMVTRVIDRGPYTHGTAWDLTNGARRALGFGGSGRIRYAVALSFARR